MWENPLKKKGWFFCWELIIELLVDFPAHKT